MIIILKYNKISNDNNDITSHDIDKEVDDNKINHNKLVIFYKMKKRAEQNTEEYEEFCKKGTKSNL